MSWNSTLSTKTPMKRAAMAKPKMGTHECEKCKKLYVKRAMGQRACGMKCALYLIERDKRDKDRARKEALKTRSDHIRELQVIFNACIRQRDKNAGYPCISSGRPLDWSGNNVDAGHYRSIGSAPHLRFDERNVHAQSKQDNRYGSGNAVDYRIGLIARYGIEYVEALEADNEPRKWTIEELIAMKAHYRARLRELKKAGE